jgi:hypothetical protein
MWYVFCVIFLNIAFFKQVKYMFDYPSKAGNQTCTSPDW